MNTIIIDNNVYCKLCDYTPKSIAEWYKHLSTKKHKRDGKKTSTTCTICEITFSNHWLVKKYYCDFCDVVFFAKIYHDNHFKGKKHNNRIKLKDSIDEVNKRVEFLEKNKKNENII
jgi:protein-arginine kinase activator protein McsA